MTTLTPPTPAAPSDTGLVELAGVLTRLAIATTRKGEPYCRAQLATPAAGVVVVVLSPGVYQQARAQLVAGAAVHVTGRPDPNLTPVPTVIAAQIHPLPDLEES